MGFPCIIETKKHKILFDLGPDGTLFENAAKRNIDLSAIDTVVLSHGHADHGGALRDFLEVNSKAKVYAQRKAFEPHFSKVLFLKLPIGIDRKLSSHPQLVLLDGDCKIDDELSLFTVSETGKCRSPANDALYDKNGVDTFAHEQNLIIKEDKTALVFGCGHAGVVNIMEKAKTYQPSVCIGGFHFLDPIGKKSVSTSLLSEIATELNAYENTQFYTCHCTGKAAYDILATQMPKLSYLSCGEVVEI